MKDTAHNIMVGALLALVGCSTVKDKAKDWLEQQLGNEPTQPTPDQPSPPPEQPTDPDEILFQSLRWNRGGENFSKAKRDPNCIIRDVHIRGGGGTPTLFYSGEGFQKWPLLDPKDDVTHIWAVFLDDNQDGIYERGGKFDWGRKNALERPMHHLTHYKGWDGYPRRGTPWAAVITDIKGKKRSNVATGVWP